MTDAPLSINRSPPGPSTLDYASMRAEAVRLVHAMSKPVWTDFNYSDPGVTILEQLCYALTELPYRAQFPVAELLAPPGASSIDLRRQGLAPAWSILTCNPVVMDDLRRVLIDRTPDAANVWLEKSPPQEHHGLSGLYDVYILEREDRGRRADPRRHRHDHDWRQPHHDDGEEPHRDDDWGRRDRLIRRILRAYRAHRALCEDVRSVRVLRRVEIDVHAELQIDDSADPAEVLAQAQFNLGQLFAPEPMRMTLEQQLALQPETCNAFSGPFMLRGFIAPDQLGERATAFKLDAIRQTLAKTLGVISVEGLRTSVEGERLSSRGHGQITVPEGAVFWLRTSDEQHQSFQLWRKDGPCRPDPARVRRGVLSFGSPWALTP